MHLHLRTYVTNKRKMFFHEANGEITCVLNDLFIQVIAFTAPEQQEVVVVIVTRIIVIIYR